MNKLLLPALIFALSLTAPAQAQGEPDSDSCGVGWQVTKHKTLVGTTTRGTTNAVVPPTFGMTSGTMGCVQHPLVRREQSAAMFALANYEALSIEMAEGRGEFLDGFAQALGCADVAVFGKVMQERYKTIMGGKATAVRMFDNVIQQIRQNANLTKGCA